MNRSEIFRLKLRIEEDGRIGHGTRALGLRVCSYIYNHPQHRFLPDEPFPLPWTKCSELLWGISECQAYRMLRELVDAGHLSYDGILGCPGKSHFHLIVPDRSRKFESPSTVKNDRPRVGNCDKASSGKIAIAGSRKNSRARAGMKRGPLNNTFPTEEIVSPMEVNGSLSRDRKRGGNLMGGSAVAAPQDDDDLKQRRSAEIRELRKKLKGS